MAGWRPPSYTRWDMKKDLLKKVVSHQTAIGMSPSIRETANKSAQAPAAVADLASLDRAQIDFETARHEQAAERDLDPQEPGLDPTLPTNPVQGEPGHQVPEAPSEDEDAEGRSLSEQLYADGAKQAERDKVSHAVQASGQGA